MHFLQIYDKFTYMDDLVRKVISFMRERHMLQPGERVVAGVSGGADSVCLLFVLLEWKKKFGLELAAVHVNHGIRAEAGEDAKFVEELCQRLGVPFFLRQADVREFAARQKCSEEEAGRILRYEAFEEVAREFGADKIAIAHNLNDRSETMLFQLFRGSGLKGLAGILPVRGKIIRPLLGLERSEIEAYLAEMGQDYCRDATNEEDHYTRNRIRHHILPYVEQEIVSGCVRHMGSAAELLAETEDYMERQTMEALKKCVEGPCGEVNRGLDGKLDGGLDEEAKTPSGLVEKSAGTASIYRMDVPAFKELHPAIQKRVLYALIKALSPGAKDISRVHVEDVRGLFVEEGNRQICLPFGICAWREYDGVILGCDPEAGKGKKGENGKKTIAVLPEGMSGESLIEIEDGLEAEISVLSVDDLPQNLEKMHDFPQNQCTKWFDYDKIKEPPIFRTRATGDFLTISDGRGGMHHKSLKDYMVTEKIPKSRREVIPVLAEGQHILWLVGYRISEYYKITENTKRILQVQLKHRCETEDKNGGTC